eukprot:TRINITY_DN13665_c0_g1_i1.p1 TRINITY_DN13665_c0_g1~~TRINITY_DN13665_c0_g1_i1.p1  ORF type:complete len:267 (-),score=32.33 TRINITY_DN13665_c0_g1_i1:162-962(-)
MWNTSSPSHGPLAWSSPADACQNSQGVRGLEHELTSVAGTDSKPAHLSDHAGCGRQGCRRESVNVRGDEGTLPAVFRARGRKLGGVSGSARFREARSQPQHGLFAESRHWQESPDLVSLAEGITSLPRVSGMQNHPASSSKVFQRHAGDGEAQREAAPDANAQAMHQTRRCRRSVYNELVGPLDEVNRSKFRNYSWHSRRTRFPDLNSRKKRVDDFFMVTCEFTPDGFFRPLHADPSAEWEQWRSEGNDSSGKSSNSSTPVASSRG